VLGARDAGAEQRPAERGWLLLIHHLPAEPAYLRVKVRRRLERIGAMLLKNSVYVLPFGEDTQEDFEWLRREIERDGGECTLSRATFMDEDTDARLIAAFRQAREDDYRSFAQSARELLAGDRGERGDRNGSVMPEADRSRMRRRLEEVRAIDFFQAPGRAAAEAALAELSRLGRTRGPEPGGAEGRGSGRMGEFVGRIWVTRIGVKVDRMASAWLIRRFIDPAARFRFVPARGHELDASEIPFDMYEGEFTHVGDACTFETLLSRFDLSDPALAAIGEIVHDIDCKDDRYGRPEATGVASLLDGIAKVSSDDAERLERGAALFDQLLGHFRNVGR
jgi:hypothetical protein